MTLSNVEKKYLKYVVNFPHWCKGHSAYKWNSAHFNEVFSTSKHTPIQNVGD